jgi:hypothetical protein
MGCVQEEMFEAMEEKAAELTVQGVAAFMIIPDDEESGQEWYPFLRIIGRFHRGPDSDRAEGDSGANYAAIAFTKIAEMVRTGRNSGESGAWTPKGEFGYRGGITWTRTDTEGARFFLAFSGGSEDEDVEISIIGKDAFNTGLDELTEQSLRAMKAMAGLVGGMLVGSMFSMLDPDDLHIHRRRRHNPGEEHSDEETKDPRDLLH